MVAKTSGKFTKAAKYISENALYDNDTETLFLSNPGISFDVLKSLSKKRNFTIGTLADHEYVSIPTRMKYEDEISLYDDFMASYTYYNNNYDTLLKAYQTFKLLDENQGEISLMLDTYVAEVLSQGFVDNPLSIKISNKTAETLVQKVLYKNRIYQRLPNITRELAKYGNFGLLLSYPYLEEWMKDDHVDFPRLDILEDLVISFVKAEDFKVNADEYNRPVNYEVIMRNDPLRSVATSKQQYTVWQPWQFCHFSLPDMATDPYGKSMLWSMRSAFDQLTNLEALLALSRASKIQRLVFYVPMPNGINLVDSYDFMNDFRARYLNSIFTDSGNAKAARKIPGAMSILTLPMSHDGKKVEVDHIESNIDLSSVEDVDYFLDKVLRNSALPKGYLVGEDTITTAQTLEAQDLKLKRTLLPLKQGLLTGIMHLVENILTHAGYDVNKLEIEINLNEPIQVPADIIGKYADIIELLGGFLEMNNAMPTINKFQFLVKMGMPSDIAALAVSKAPLTGTISNDELGKFLINQKTVDNQALPAPKGDENGPLIGESKSMKYTSKQFLTENHDLALKLKSVRDTLYLKEDINAKTQLLRGRKVLTEDA